MTYRVRVKVVFFSVVKVIEADFQKAADLACERTLEKVMGVVKEKCGDATSFSAYGQSVESLDVQA